MLGFGMIAVFGFLAFRNFATGRHVWGAVSALGLLLGMASVWVDYQRQTADRSAGSADTRASHPWAKDA